MIFMMSKICDKDGCTRFYVKKFVLRYVNLLKVIFNKTENEVKYTSSIGKLHINIQYTYC